MDLLVLGFLWGVGVSFSLVGFGLVGFLRLVSFGLVCCASQRLLNIL